MYDKHDTISTTDFSYIHLPTNRCSIIVNDKEIRKMIDEDAHQAPPRPGASPGTRPHRGLKALLCTPADDLRPLHRPLPTADHPLLHPGPFCVNITSSGCVPFCV